MTQVNTSFNDLAFCHFGLNNETYRVEYVQDGHQTLLDANSVWNVYFSFILFMCMKAPLRQVVTFMHLYVYGFTPQRNTATMKLLPDELR